MPRRSHGCSANTLTKEYTAWKNIKVRLRPNWKQHNRYADRGITLHPKWRDSFEAFLADVGLAPSPEHSIDRIDNDGNYEPGNVRWATRVEQLNNYSLNVYLEVDGVRRTVAEWSRVTGIKYATLDARRRRGKSPAEVIAPVQVYEEGGSMNTEPDDLYEPASRLVVKEQKASITLLQRALRIGFSRASALMETMEEDGLVTAPYSDGRRMMRVKADYFVAVDAELSKAETQ